MRLTSFPSSEWQGGDGAPMCAPWGRWVSEGSPTGVRFQGEYLTHSSISPHD
jgi:hypothetical protein